MPRGNSKKGTPARGQGVKRRRTADPKEKEQPIASVVNPRSSAFTLLAACIVSVTNGLECLSCESVAHPFLCEHTMQCFDGSICSVEKLFNSGDITYKLGCMDTTKCHSKRSSFGTDIELCRECCTSDVCNLKGCGKETMHINRGPICYNCDGMSDPTKCHRVKVCNADELCLAQESFRWNVKLFKSSCENKHICQAIDGRLPIVGRRKRSYVLKHKRSALCSKCCSVDMCNTGCRNVVESTTSSLLMLSKTVNVTTPTTMPKTSVSKTNISKSLASGYYEYHIIFTETYANDYNTPHLYILATTSGSANIFSLQGNINMTIALSKGGNTVNLSNSVFTTDGKERKGVHVYASVPMIIHAVYTGLRSGDGYLAIPSKFLSKNYIVPSFKVFGKETFYYSLIGIVATANDVTHVKIKLNLRNNMTLVFNSTTLINGETLSVTLSKFETFQISHQFDLSGSMISSSHPIGIVSGNKCNAVDYNYYCKTCCNMFIEMILPTNQFDNEYVIPKVHRYRITVRVFCPTRTLLQIYHSDGKLDETKDVKKQTFYEFEDQSFAIIKSDKPVLVMAYPDALESQTSYMMTIYGINQYKTEYDIFVSDRLKTMFTLTMHAGDPDGFLYDHNGISTSGQYNRTIFGTTYTTLFFGSLRSGIHTISHRSNISFGLWLFGEHEQSNASYGFPGGMAYFNYP